MSDWSIVVDPFYNCKQLVWQITSRTLVNAQRPNFIIKVVNIMISSDLRKKLRDALLDEIST